jgi:Holliday junction resolvasome RuvABC endonuclease subunit
MPPKKTVSGKPLRRQSVGQSMKRASTKNGDAELSRRLHDLRDQIDIVLPEVTARVAALEHLLLDKQLCTKADLVRAREFVRTLEA